MSKKRKAILNLSLLIAGLVILVPFLLLFIITSIDPNNYKTQIEEQFLFYSGRKLKLNGNIELELLNKSLTPYLKIEDASIEDADWSTEKYFLKAGDLRVQFQLKPLIKNNILVFDSIIIRNTAIHAVKNRKGITNWMFKKNTPDNTAKSETGNLKKTAIKPVFKYIKLENIKISYADQAKQINTRVFLERLLLQEEENKTTIKSNGDINNEPFTFSGHSGSISDIINNNTVPVFLTGKSAGIAIETKGEIAQPVKNTNINLLLKLDSKDLNRPIKLLTGQKAPPELIPLHLESVINFSDSTYNVRINRLLLNDSNVSGNISITTGLSRPVIKLSLASDRINLDSFFPESRTQAGNTKKSRKKSDFSIPSTPVKTFSLPAIDAYLDLKAKSLSYRGITSENNRLESQLLNNTLTVSKFETGIFGGKIHAKTSIKQNNGKTFLSVNGEATEIHLEKAAKGLKINGLNSGDISISTNLKSSASNLKSLVYNLNGHTQISINDFHTTQKTGNNKPVRINISNLDILFKSVRKDISYSLISTIDNEDLIVKGNINSLYNLLESKPYFVSADINSHGISSTIHAEFSEPFNPESLTSQSIHLKAKATVPHPDITVTRINHFLDSPVPMKNIPAKYFSASASIQGTMNKFKITNLRIQSGQSDISGNIAVNSAKQPVHIKAGLFSNTINLDELVTNEPFKSDKRKTGNTGNTGNKKLFSDNPLNLDFLALVNADISLDISTLKHKIHRLNNIHLQASSDDKSIAIQDLAFNYEEGKFRGNLDLTQSSSTEIGTTISMKKFDFGKLMSNLGHTPVVTGKFDTEINLAATGNTPHLLMSGLNGNIFISMENGRLDSKALELLSKNLANLLPSIGNEDRQKLRCAVANFTISNGIATSSAIILDTGLISALGTGSINLGNETLDFYLEPHAKKTSLAKIAMVPVNINGPLISPSVIPNIAGTTVSTVKTAAHIGLAIATSGISLAAEDLTNNVWNTIIDANDYCATALAGKPIDVKFIKLLTPSDNPDSAPETGTDQEPSSPVDTNERIDYDWE